MKTRYNLFLLLALSTGLLSCGEKFLDVKPDKALVVPESLIDFQALLDNVSNTTGSGVFNSSPGLNTIADGDFTTTSTSLQVVERNAYSWAGDIFQGASTKDWNDPYAQIFYTNVVLDGLKKLVPKTNEQNASAQVKGTALFFRAFAFFNLLQQFCAPYSVASGTLEMGLPIRLEADVNVRYSRGNLTQSCARVIADLNDALSLLPSQSTLKTRPDQTAAKALLARVYLYMGNYEQALQMADRSLKVYSTLMDYNVLSVDAASATNPFPKVVPINSNPEVLFYAAALSYSFSTSTLSSPEAGLYSSYDQTDLRKSLFFVDRGKGLINFKGNYTGDTKLFSGLATDELYLIRAECYARKGETLKAMDDLNALLVKRHKKNSFTGLAVSDAESALCLILKERRKELVLRSLRWSDLKRLNQDVRFAAVITRVYNGISTTLLPGDPKYAFPLPDNEVNLGEIPQNPR